MSANQMVAGISTRERPGHRPNRLRRSEPIPHSPPQADWNDHLETSKNLCHKCLAKDATRGNRVSSQNYCGEGEYPSIKACCSARQDSTRAFREASTGREGTMGRPGQWGAWARSNEVEGGNGGQAFHHTCRPSAVSFYSPLLYSFDLITP